MVASAAASLLALLESFVTVLVVDFAGFGFGEGFVCFCYFYKLLLGCIIASVFIVRSSIH